MPVASATVPPMTIARRIPVPAAFVAAPNAAKIPVPTIIPAVKSVAPTGASSRFSTPVLLLTSIHLSAASDEVSRPGRHGSLAASSVLIGASY